ncbi:hypothetical protein ASG11_08890 [Sphingomonas sp. Leaf357]|uniref:asparagine synthase (glutamine-hydrolyzing) n=1 Tax=Sphingomonas sp. Leaf357 TaxID=1736350 RepID=UPI0006FE9CE1|nr:asparagine synthase (glutamine-hydrolyzing) [Sphingomonas sp. Leaf357]KQS04352.1 hypothetical protein ASG11_08890 [Sphingomonas sp. Leaf357]
MCGITGLIGPGAAAPEIIAAMTKRIGHRGPDDQGTWRDAETPIALGHRRLAIVDLSPTGHEPMISASGRLVVVFNGEIYNHVALRKRLDAEGRAPEGGWRGHSDIETFLEAIEHWGLDSALDSAVGMFALAIWDRQLRRASLVRDRFGEKPLYYGWVGGDFAFGSELKALAAHPRFDNGIDRAALTLLTERAYIPAPFSIYHGIYKLLPGTILEIEGTAPPSELKKAPVVGRRYDGLSIRQFYSYRNVVRSGTENRFVTEGDATDALNAALRAAIVDQSVADVPVGVFLSGGIDSSTVTALYQSISDTPIRSFSIGFSEAGYNEAEDAKRIAAHLGTVHHELYVSPGDALEVIPLLPEIYDEPFADSSQVPTYLVSRFARQHVSVALTGDAGDELFGGYYRHFMVEAIWEKLRSVPRFARAIAARPASGMPDAILSAAARTAGFGGIAKDPGKIRKFLAIIGTSRGLEDVLQSFLDEWTQQPSIVLGGDRSALHPDLDLGSKASALDRVTYHDAVSYMSDDILCKVDRAAMAVSLETRVPMLDHRVAAVAARISPGMKIQKRKGKIPLRTLLDRHVPVRLTDRPKAGFAAPVDHWLRGPLRDWAEALLDAKEMREDGWFDTDRVQTEWRQFLAGNAVPASRLWPILMFQAWKQHNNR